MTRVMRNIAIAAATVAAAALTSQAVETPSSPSDRTIAPAPVQQSAADLRRAERIVDDKANLVTRVRAQYSDGVLSHRFVGMGRCSQVEPLMRDIAAGMCSSTGRMWCDEQGNVTIAYIACRR